MTALAFAVSLLSLQHAPPPILRVWVDSSRHQVVLTVTPIDLSAGHGAEPHASIHAGGELPLLRFLWPVDGWARSASLRLSAEGGTALPRAILHHINVINFGRRQLFYPIAERLLAMGQETEDIRLPATVGVPVAVGMPMGLVAAFHNPGHELVNSITLELRIDFAPANQVPRPISVLPAYLDVQNPVAHDVDFDLPAGASIWTADFTIPISGRILGAGGHLHDYGTALELLDVTESSPRVVLRLGTRRDRNGRLLAVGRALPGVTGKGIRLHPSRRYRLVGEYRNSSGEAIVKGAMVHLILLFSPDRVAQWPPLLADSPEFRNDVIRLEGMGTAR